LSRPADSHGIDVYDGKSSESSNKSSTSVEKVQLSRQTEEDWHHVSEGMLRGDMIEVELGRYSVFLSVFFHVGSVFGIGIGISEIMVENRKFLVGLYPTSIWRTC